MFTGINDSLFTIIGKSALQYGGELVYAADCRDDALVFNEELLNSFSSVFDRYQVNGLALMGQTEFDPAMLTPPGVTLSAVRSRLSDEEAFRVQDDYFAFPCASQGNNMEEGNLFEITSVLSAYGMAVSYTHLWRQKLCDALDIAVSFGFFRPVAQYGAAILPLLESCGWDGDAAFLEKLTRLTRQQAALYPDYLRCV